MVSPLHQLLTLLHRSVTTNRRDNDYGPMVINDSMKLRAYSLGVDSMDRVELAGWLVLLELYIWVFHST